MAIVEADRPWWTSITLGGIDDSTQTRRYNLVAADAAAAETAADSIRAKLLAISAGVLVSYKIEHVYVNDAYVRGTDTDGEGGEQAVVSGKIDDQPLESWSLNIPFPKIGIFLATVGKNRNVVDIGDTDLLAFVNAFGSAGDAYLSDGEHVGTIEQGRRK
jgi:hypothetical protein